MSNINAAAAFAVSADVSPDYLAKCLSTRLAASVERAGSWFADDVANSPEALLDVLAGASWEVYPHPAIKSPAVAFKAPIKGRNGMVALASLPAHALITLIDPKGGAAFWDQKQKVGASVVAADYNVVAPQEDFTTLIVGPVRDDAEGRHEVWTFHPGAPLAPSMVDRIAPDGSDRHGQRVTVAEAIALGFDFAKLT